MQPRRLSIASSSALPKSDALYFPGIGDIVAHPPGPDWVHPSIAVQDTHSIGLGLVAANLIPRDSTVIFFGGTIMTWRQVLDLPEDMRDIPYQISDDLFFGIAERKDIGTGERINHSCNPNAGFVSEMKLVAMRDILPGEPVTMDYATCSSLEDYELYCRCGEKGCRGIVRGTDWKNPELQIKLRGYFQPYLQEKIVRARTRNLAASLSRTLRHIANLLSPMDA